MRPRIKRAIKVEYNRAAEKTTSYDTSNAETSNPQRVREGNESSSEFARQRLARRSRSLELDVQ